MRLFESHHSVVTTIFLVCWHLSCIAFRPMATDATVFVTYNLLLLFAGPNFCLFYIFNLLCRTEYCGLGWNYHRWV